MNLAFTWIDHLRTLTVSNMNAFAAAAVLQLEEIVNGSNTWAARDHNNDGTHNVIRLKAQSAAPVATPQYLTLYWDGGDLKVVFPNGTTGTVTIT